MSPKGQISHKQVWEMLDECAPGWSKVKAPHHYRVYANGEVFMNFPFGDRKAKRTGVQVHWVRKLARHVGILDCAKRVLKQLG